MLLTAERLRDLISYDQESGIFVWKKSGKVAGYITNEGYRNISVDNRMYRAHRLAWLYVTGEWPIDQIDHINGSRDANWFANLREASALENGKNLKKPATNSSGFKGVSWHKRSGKWQAVIASDRKTRHIGLFDTPEAARTAYCEAAVQLHGEFVCLDR